jgi:asparagine synthase (glutamine-hydrolysing)
MISDVPFGVFLSGGIDSAANLGLMTEILTQPVNSFTIGYQDDLEFNELAAARVTANHFGAVHHEIVIGRDEFWEAVLDSPRYADEPTGTPECIPLYHLSRFTRSNGVKVIQVGEGSDELFGYPGWPRLLRIGRLMGRIGRFLPARRATMLLASRAAALAGKYHYSTFLDWYARGTPHYQTSMPYPRYFREMMYGPVLRQQDPEEEMEGQLGRLAIAPGSMGPLDDYQSLLWFELTHRLPENILARVDRMTMSSSVEARVPFLDHRLVDYTFFLPEGMRFEHGAKSLLKGAIRDRVLPSSILDRPKRGFGTPVQRWINEDLFSETRRLILNCALVKYGILDPVGIESMINYGRMAYRHNLPGQRSVYQLLLLCRWYDLHF